MARDDARLTGGAFMRLWAVILAVVLLHALALQWLAAQLGPMPALRPLAAPMFTRLLQAQAPTVPVPVEKSVIPARPRRPAITSITHAPATPHARTASRKRRTVAPPPSVAASAAETTEQASAALTQPSEAKLASSPSETTTLPIVEEPELAARTPENGHTIAAPAPPFAVPKPPASATATLDSWPADTRLNYRLGGQFRDNELHGNAQVQWQRQGGRYESRVNIDLTLLANLVLISQGDVTPQGLLPRGYEELRRSGPRSVRLEDESIVLTDGRRMPRPAGVQDTASQFVELSHRFTSGQDVLEVGRSVSFWMARPGGVDLWTYDIVERETLQLPSLGAVEAFHLKPRPIVNARGNITAEMWFAPNLQYLPVRIRVNMGDAAYVDLVVEKIEQR